MKLNIKQLWVDKFIRGTFWLTAANFFGSALNYLVHPILTRHLSVAAYGDFQALLSFTMIIGVISVVVTTTLTKETAILASNKLEEVDALRHRATKRLFYLGLIIFVIIALFINPLNNLFNIAEPFVLIFASLNLFFIFPLVVNRAVLTGLQRFGALSLSTLSDAVFRLAFIVLLVVFYQFQLSGAAWSLGIAAFPAFLLAFWQIKRLKLPSAALKSQNSSRTIWGYAFLVLWFTILSQLFHNFDMLFVKSSFSPEEAGLYGAMLTIGRIVLFVGGSIPLVMFPVIAGLKDDVSSRKYFVLIKSLGLMFLLAFPTAVIISVFPEFMINLIVGNKYMALAGYLPLFAWTIFFLTLLTVISQYFLALSRRSGLVILTGGAIFEIITLNFFHSNIWQIIWSLFFIFGAISLALLGLCLRDYYVHKKGPVAADKIKRINTKILWSELYPQIREIYPYFLGFYLLSLFVSLFSHTWHSWFYWPAFHAVIMIFTAIFIVDMKEEGEIAAGLEGGSRFAARFGGKIKGVKIIIIFFKLVFLSFRNIFRKFLIEIRNKFKLIRLVRKRDWIKVLIILIIAVSSWLYGISTWEFILLLYGLISLLFLINSRYAAIIALIFLTVCPLLLIFKKGGWAQTAAANAFYALAIAVMTQFREILRQG